MNRHLHNHNYIVTKTEMINKSTLRVLTFVGGGVVAKVGDRSTTACGRPRVGGVAGQAWRAAVRARAGRSGGAEAGATVRAWEAGWGERGRGGRGGGAGRRRVERA
jgi:hypothetical protein